MNTRKIVVIALSACFLLGIGAVAVQRNQIATLRDQQSRFKTRSRKCGAQSSDFAIKPQAETS